MSVLKSSMLAVAAACALICFNAGDADASVVRGEQGQLRGAKHDATIAYLGVPYAAAPVGDLRWRPPPRFRQRL